MNIHPSAILKPTPLPTLNAVSAVPAISAVAAVAATQAGASGNKANPAPARASAAASTIVSPALKKAMAGAGAAGVGAGAATSTRPRTGAAPQEAPAAKLPTLARLEANQQLLASNYEALAPRPDAARPAA